MIKIAFKKQIEKKLIIQNILLFIVFMFIYSMLDYLGYRDAKQNKIVTATWLYYANVFMNLVLTTLSVLTIGLSTANMYMNKKEVKVSGVLPFFALVVGFFTFGCTTCVVTFFINLGIGFLATASNLVGYGFWFKFLSLGLLLLGFLWTLYVIKKGVCKIKKPKQKPETL